MRESELYLSSALDVAVHYFAKILGSKISISLQAHRVTEPELYFLAVIALGTNKVLVVLYRETVESEGLSIYLFRSHPGGQTHVHLADIGSGGDAALEDRLNVVEERTLPGSCYKLECIF